MHPSGTSSARRRGALGLVVAVVAATVGLTTTPASADGLTFTVDSTVDAVDANIGNGVCATAAGACTLRAAVQEANATTAADTIVLVPGAVHALSIVGNENSSAAGDLDLNRSVTIVGNGATIDVSQLNQTTAERIVHVRVSGTHATLTDLVLSGGKGNAGAAWVGPDTELNLERSWVTSNTDTNTNQGVITVEGHLAVTDTTFSENTSGSPTNRAAGIYVAESGELTLTNSTMADNTGQALAIRGGATVTSSTIGANGGGGPQVQLWGSEDADEIHFQSTVIDAAGGPACALGVQTLSSDGHNLATDGTCGFADATDQPSTQPLLSPLSVNGSVHTLPLPTRQPRVASPLVDHGVGCSLTDQRGMPRPQGAACDIGAGEFDAAVTVLGPEGQFRSLGQLDADGDGRVTSLTDETIRLEGIDDFAFPDGVGPYFPTMTNTGKVVIGTMPITGNNMDPAGRSQTLSTLDPLDPVAPTLTHTAVPLRYLDGSERAPALFEAPKHQQVYPTGYLADEGGDLGGADISDVCTVGSGPSQRVMATSASPFKNWHVNPGKVWQVTHTKLDGQGASYQLEIGGLPGTATTATIWGGSNAATVESAIQNAINGPLGGAGNDVQVTLTSQPDSKGTTTTTDDTTTRAYLLTFRGRLSTQDVTVEVEVNPSTGWIDTPTAGPYDSRHFGTYPSIIGLDPTTGTIDETITATANQLAGDTGSFPRSTFDTAFGENRDGETEIYSSQAFAECAPLDNGQVTITQYARTAGLPTGRIVVLEPNPGSGTSVVTSLQLPTASELPECLSGAVTDNRCIPLADGFDCVSGGCSVNLSPRDVASWANGDGTYEIAIIYDALVDVASVTNGANLTTSPTAPFPLQVLHYDPAAPTLTLTTPLVIPQVSQPGGTGSPTRYNMAILADGHLFAAVSDSVWPATSRRIDVFDLSGATCPLPTIPVGGPGTWTESTTTACQQMDLSTWEAGVGPAPIVTAALDFDPARNLLLVTSSQGILRVLHWDGSTLTKVRDVDLGGYHLLRTSCTPSCGAADRAHWVRKGALDEERGVYYLTFFGSATNAHPIPDAHYMFAVDLDQVATPG